jgi:serine/threonine protein kinase
MGIATSRLAVDEQESRVQNRALRAHSIAAVSSTSTTMTTSTTTPLTINNEISPIEHLSSVWKGLESQIVNSIQNGRHITTGKSSELYEINLHSKCWALKQYNSEFYDIQSRQIILAEIERMIDPKFKNENLMVIDHCFFYKGRLYVLMEKMDGSLDQLLYSMDEKTQELRSLLMQRSDQLLKLLLQIAKGIQILHAENCFHRNLNPRKILLNQTIVDGKVELANVKLIGFGVSKRGDTCYIAPEVKQNVNKFTSKSDIYSFGVLLGEIICGIKPKRNVDYTFELLRRIGYGTLFEIYEMCTKENPSDRPDITSIVRRLTECLT